MKVLNFLDNVSCKVFFIFIIFFFIRAKGELNRPVNVMSISQTLLRVSLLPICCKGTATQERPRTRRCQWLTKTHTRTGTLRQTESLRGSLSNNDSDGNGNENGKTAIYRIYKQNNFASASHFLFFFLSLFFLHDYDVNIPKSNDFLFLFLKLDILL